LVWDKGFKVQLAAALGVLFAYWLLFALWPIGEIAGHHWADPAKHTFEGLAAHWNINANPAHHFDRWFLNLFPREEAFEFHPQGYNTLNFIPSLAIMIFGLCCGELLRKGDRTPKGKLKTLLAFGAAAIIAGVALHFADLCPLVKKTWTPSFTLFSGGICVAFLGFLYWLIDLKGLKRWTFPFVVMGMNSIALYCMLWLIPYWMHETIRTHFGEGYGGLFGEAFAPLVQNLIVGACLWLICFWMYRRKIFLRI
jgi:predicted acyltransferase